MGIVAEPVSRHAIAAARQGCQLHAPDLYLASFFLPRPRRQAVWAVAAFCQLTAEALDDTADTCATPTTLAGSCCTPSEQDQRLALFLDRLSAIYADQLAPAQPQDEPQRLIIDAFAHAVRRYEVPREYFADLAAALSNQARIRRHATWKRLETHLHASAGSVALAMTAIVGVTHSDARQHILDLASAIGLAGILRNLRTDAARGRIYLPLEDLAAARYSEKDLANGIVNERFQALIRLGADRARGLLYSATQAIPWLAGQGARLAFATLISLATGQWDHLAKRPSFEPRPLTPAQRLARVPAAWRLARGARCLGPTNTI